MRSALLFVAMMLSTVAASVEAGELLQSISEDTAIPSSEASPNQSDHDRIIYRVSCGPEDEMLPDCERSFSDHQPILATPDFPPDADEATNTDPEVSEAVTTTKVVTPTRKLSQAATRKKSAKVSSKSVKSQTKSKAKSKVAKTQTSSKSSKNKKTSAKAKSKSKS